MLLIYFTCTILIVGFCVQILDLEEKENSRMDNWTSQLENGDALAGNCYCKVIYYFHKFNMCHYLFI